MHMPTMGAKMERQAARGRPGEQLPNHDSQGGPAARKGPGRGTAPAPQIASAVQERSEGGADRDFLSISFSLYFFLFLSLSISLFSPLSLSLSLSDRYLGLAKRI